MGGACNTHWRGAKYVKGSWWENMKKKDHLEDLDVDGRKLKCLYKEQDGNM